MAGRAVILGAGVAGLTTALALARGGVPVDVLERDRAQAPLGRRSAATWVREGAPQVQHAHVFGPDFHRLLARELPDVLALLLAAGAHEFSVGSHDLPAAELSAPGHSSGGSPGPGSALALRRPLLDWVLRRVAEREPGVRVHCGTPATGLRTDGSRLTGVLVEGGVLAADLAVDATGSRTRTAAWLADLGYSCAHPVTPDPPASTTYYSRCYSRRWPGDPGAVDFGAALGGGFDGYQCRAVPGDNDTFTVTFGIPDASVDAAAVPSALRMPQGFQAAAEHVPLIADWVDPRTADPLTGVAVLKDWPPPGGRGVPDLASLPGLVAVGDARGASDPAAADGVTVAMAQGLACASAILACESSSAELEKLVGVAGVPAGEPGLPVPRKRPLGGPNVRELARIADSVGRVARISA
ncbi:MAG TPA: FAD-dependent oxidoreductase [Pseudonocardia sp.]|nr:FAD-dependent oxidoreductase [Pseudonocardia sp.]